MVGFLEEIESRGTSIGEITMAKKILLAILAGLLALVGLGAGYQGIRSAQDLADFPAPGKLYEVDGLTLHLDCRGSGSPTVILEAGLTMGSLSWALVHDEIAKNTQVCAYDRPGIDWSEPIGREVSSTEIRDRLYSLLQVAQIEDDFVLVGMSAGGIFVRNFYQQYPQHVHGMVLVDSAHEQQNSRAPEDLSGQLSALEICRFTQPIGLIRAFGLMDQWAEGVFAASDELATIFKTNLNRSHSCAASYWELKSAVPAASDIEKAPESLGSLPLIVLSQGKPVTGEEAITQRKQWNILQKELTALSTEGEQYFAEQSYHGIQFSQPEFVVEKIGSLVDKLRRSSF